MHVASVPFAANVPARHAVHEYSSLERVSSTPQLPVRTEPGLHCRLAHVAFGHASLIWPAAPSVKYWSSPLVHGVQLPAEPIPLSHSASGT